MANNFLLRSSDVRTGETRDLKHQSAQTRIGGRKRTKAGREMGIRLGVAGGSAHLPPASTNLTTDASVRCSPSFPCAHHLAPVLSLLSRPLGATDTRPTRSALISTFHFFLRANPSSLDSQRPAIASGNLFLPDICQTPELSQSLGVLRGAPELQGRKRGRT